jgi:anti-anti-sigma regulatory factor
MSLTINVREATNATILELGGRLTLGASGPSLRDTVRGLLDSLRKNIVLDLS